MTGIISQNLGRPSGLIKATAGAGAWNLIQEQSGSGSSTIAFTSGIDSTYPIYVFKFMSMHPSSEQELVMDFSSDGGSTYDKLYSTTFFRSAHNDAGTDGSVVYVTSRDLASSGSRPFLSVPIGTESDNSCSGEMYLFDPSNTTFFKHFLTKTNIYVADGSDAGSYSQNSFVSGYAKTTSAINAVKFEMDGGNIDAGTIKMYGIKDS